MGLSLSDLAQALPTLRTSSVMGRVRTKTVKKSAKVIIEKYYTRLTSDFHTKKICDEVAVIPSKRLRNKIAGFTTHLMKRIQAGPVRGISIKLQEEERERRDNYVPEVSVVDARHTPEVDPDTKAMLNALGFGSLPVTETAPLAIGAAHSYHRGGRRGPRA